MNEFMKTLLSLSVSGTLLLLPILGLKQLYQNKFSRRWQYYVWIIVILRFLLPFAPSTTIVGSLFEKIDAITITNEISTSINAPVSANVDNSETEPIQTNKDITTIITREPLNIYVCLFFVWSAFALALFVRKVTAYQGFVQYIKAGNMEVSDIKILNLLSDCEEKLNIKTRVELSYNSLTTSPIMIGFFRPNIILPVKELGNREMSYIFMHELIHYKKRDMYYKLLVQIAICVHWFNPFVYLLEKEVNRSCELSCDEAVVSILDDKAKQEYGDMLVSFVKANKQYQNSLASVTLTEGAEQLKERLGAIMELKKKSKSIKVFTALLTCVFCICFMVSGAYAAPGQTEEKEPREQKPDEQKMEEPEQSEQKMKELQISVSDDDNYKSVYTQNGYLYHSYIIEMGWNAYGYAYSNQTELILKDGTVMKVYFTDTSKNLIADQGAIATTTELLSYLKDMNTYPTIETPVITKIVDVSEKDISVLREEFYQDGDVYGFSALFSLLDEVEQKEWYQKLYEANNITFFSAVIGYMDNDLISAYVDKADQDRKISFFSAFLNYLQPDTIKQYAEKYYGADDIARFTVIIPYMTEKEQQDWLKKAQTDKKNAFSTVLSDYLF